MNVKVTLYRSWREEPIEIRRLSWEPSEAVVQFRDFVEKVAAVFPGLSSEELKLHWTDEDGDRILISSDEELSLGLQSAGGQLFRVHALHVPKEEAEQEQPKPTAPQPGQEPRTGRTHHHHHHRGSRDGAYHHGVVCDGCEGHIFGIRYKCLSCVDFDLCSSCEAKGLHSQHNMVAMEHPQPHFGWGHWGRGRGRRCGQWRGGHPYYHQGQQSWGCPWGDTRGGTCQGGPSQLYGDFFGGSTEQRREAVHQVLQQITPFLHHFGVDVDARVVDDPPKEEPAKEGEGSKPTPPTTTQDTMDDGQPAPDDPVAAVTQQLQSMGFDDEGGWLTELVRARGGDIDKVLETLHWEK